MATHYDSAVFGYAVMGYKIFGKTFTQSVSPPRVVAQDVQLTIYDENMDAVGRIKNAEAFSYTENWYSPDTWELRIGAAKLDIYNLISEIKTKGHIGFTGDDGLMKIGIIENIEKPYAKRNAQWRISGRGARALLERRKLMNGYSTSTGYDSVTGVAYETAMRHYVDVNCINALGADGSAAANRVITGLSLFATDGESNGDSAVDCEYPGRAQSLLDTLADLSKASGLSFDLTWKGENEGPGDRYLFEFNVHESNDVSADVILTVDLGNVISYDYQESILGYKNFAYVAGTGDANARELSTVFSGTEPSGRDRFEDYIDASDCATADELTQRGLETLSQKSIVSSLTFDYDPYAQSEVYGVDFVCGDRVTIRDPDVAEIVDRIVSVKTTWNADGKNIQVGVGTAPPDLTSIIKLDRKQNTSTRR